MREVRKCAVCNKCFVATMINAKYCGDECYRYGRIEKKSENRQRVKAAKKSRKEKQQEFIDIAVAARKAGMSYGQYVAKMGL